MPKITLNKFNGLAPNYYGGTGGTILRGVPYADSMLNINPFTDPGYIQPGFAYTTAQSGTPLTTAITSMVAAHNGTAPQLYAFGETKLYKFTGTSLATITNDGTFPRTISDVLTGAAYQNDLLVTWLRIAAATPDEQLCLLYSYNDTDVAGTAKLGRYNITANSFSDAAYTLTTNTIPDPGNNNSLYVDRTMIKAPNGVVYIAGGVLIDSLNTSTTDAAIITHDLKIDLDYRIKSFGWYDNKLVIVCVRATSTSTLRGGIRVYMWDTFSPTWNDSFEIQDSKAGAMYWDNDEIFLLTGDNLVGKIRKFNGLEFPVVQEIPKSIPKPSSIDNFRDGFIFASGDADDSNNKIFAYFSLSPGEPRQLWQVMTIIGTVYNVKRFSAASDALWHFAGVSGGTNYLAYTNAASWGSGQYTWPVIELPHRSTVTRGAVYHASLGADAAVDINYGSNYSSSYTNYLTSDTDSTTHKVLEKSVPDISAISPQLEWDASGVAAAAQVARVEIDYEPNPNAKAS